ncbi:lignostilbene-alpha,beta-dioxygenase [Rubidibacter lacunae KORDI 51-2]|uniref:Lignostilbene-alpha,beta-dioxygenase n=1 Tax=Rubidibacter lacunae KORDI 51-2 TaxID=582515 RepID=U5DNA0_9CHRO|nr:carotenoid oxygenase family protein [Rubidibacter lacunae]ERN43131.1 lignostilbene-alpha,beta-dioxygenase [Rubidibacter lacunae KORDI 51-2]
MTSTQQHPPAGASMRFDDWRLGYESQRREEAYWLDREAIVGTIPAELQGTLFRNGPGLLDVGGTPIHHPFDGDGTICAVTFRDGRAHFQNRFVRTEGFCAEQAGCRILYRGVFGTQKPGGWTSNAFDFRLKNIANTNVIYWGGKLLALWEAGLPHCLEPGTLETFGTDELDGAIADTCAFSAHPRVDPCSQLDGGAPCLVNFCIKPGLSTTIWVYEFTTDCQLLRKHAHSVPGFAFIHDFAITPNYCLFFQNSVSFNPIPFALGLRGAGECVKFQPQKPTRVLVVPRDPARQDVKVLEVEAGFVFHHANACELDEQTLRIDSICYADFPKVEPGSDFRDLDFSALAPGQLWRFTLNLNAGTVDRQLAIARHCEFPCVHPQHVGRPYRYLFLAAADRPTGTAPLQAILKYDWETGETCLWSAAPRGYTGEPVFVPMPDATEEDAGWLLVLTYDASAHRSVVVVLDARDLSVVTDLRLKYHIPFGLHGTWTPECFVST